MATMKSHAAFGDDEGMIAELVTRGGHWYIRTVGEAYTRDAGLSFFEPVSSQEVGMAEMRRRHDEAEMSTLIISGPMAGEQGSEIWTTGLDLARRTD